jgi:predicted phosphodiesterase
MAAMVTQKALSRDIDEASISSFVLLIIRVMGFERRAIKGSNHMRLHDLGPLNDPLMLFGGPYSNLQATQALIHEARKCGVAPQHMICTGDIVAYCGQPVETVSEIRRLNGPVVAGNCETQLAAGHSDCGCGFEAGTACDLLSAGWFAHVDQSIGDETRDWMQGLPDMITFTHHGLRYAVIHGGTRDNSRFIWETSPVDEFEQEIEQIQSLVGKVDRVIAGHCGIAFERDIAGISWINAGMIGMPPNDGHPETRYMVLQNGRVEICKLSYDHAGAQAAMRAAGLTQGYDRALGSGYWPSEDVLPPDLRRAPVASG